MLRALVALLLLANAVFWIWSQGWLDDVVGVRSTGEREPQRLAQQVRPEIVRVLPGAGPAAPVTPAAASAPDSGSAMQQPPPRGDDGAAPAAVAAGTTPNTAATPSAPWVEAAAAPAPASSASPSADTPCLEAGPFTANEVAAAMAAINRAALPSGTVRDLTGPAPNTWIIYMGRFTDPEKMAEKQSQLNRISGMKYERVRGIPELEPGLSLGRFTDRTSAQAALDDWNTRGVRTARVVALPPSTIHRLRAEGLDAATRQRHLELKAPALRDGFQPCAPADGAAPAPAR
jgi:hypothetical protein